MIGPPSEIQAQNSAKPPRFVSLGVSNVKATGAFGRHLPDQIWGFSGNYAWGSRKLPFRLGFDIGYTVWGKEHWEDWYYEGENPTWAEYRQGSQLGTMGITLRYEPKVNTRLQPYGESQVGIALFETQISVTDPDLNSSCPKPLEVYKLAWANASYGRVGAGLTFPFGYSPELGRRQAFLDFGVLYHLGGRASYMKPDVYEAVRSRTDMILTRLMVGIYLY